MLFWLCVGSATAKQLPAVWSVARAIRPHNVNAKMPFTQIQGPPATMPVVPAPLRSRASRVLFHDRCQGAAHLWRVSARDCGATLSMPRPTLDAALDVPMRNSAYAWAAYCLQRGIAQKRLHPFPRCTSNRTLHPISARREFAPRPCRVRLPEIMRHAKLP